MLEWVMIFRTVGMDVCEWIWKDQRWNAMDIMYAPKIHVEALTPSVAAFGNRAYNVVIKVKWGHVGEALIP